MRRELFCSQHIQSDRMKTIHDQLSMATAERASVRWVYTRQPNRASGGDNRGPQFYHDAREALRMLQSYVAPVNPRQMFELDDKLTNVTTRYAKECYL
jgi:hypothetical protein